MDFPDNIKLAKLNDGTFAANWFNDLQWDFELNPEQASHRYKYIGIEYGKTEFEVISKACLKCHAAAAADPDSWAGKPPTISLSRHSYWWADWKKRHHGGIESGNTAFDAIAKACLMYYVEICRSPDSRDPSDYTLTINDKEVSITQICKGIPIPKICNQFYIGRPCSYLTEDELPKTTTNNLLDSYITINEQQVSIHQICEGTAVYPPKPEPAYQPNPEYESLTVAEIMGAIARSLFPDEKNQ